MTDAEKIVDDIAIKAATRMLQELQSDHEMLHKVIDIECYKIVTIQTKAVMEAVILYMFTEYGSNHVNGDDVPKYILDYMKKSLEHDAHEGFKMGIEMREEST